MDSKDSEVALTVRLPKETLDRIDTLVKARANKIPRHSWLLEAIYEKLYKEDRVEGVLDIFWENSGEPSTTARYVMHFLNLHRRRGGPVAPRTMVGEDSLERYLIELGFKSENARGWLEKLKADRSISIPNVMMPADRVGPYGFKVSGLGIQRKLRDGRTAILYHEFPKNAPDKIRGDRILILSSSGGVEKEATVTPEGEVLVLLEKHIFPPGAPDTVYLKFRDASKEETEEFLDIHRQYTLD